MPKKLRESDAVTSGQLLLSPLFLSVLRLEDQGLTGEGGGQRGDGGGGQGQQQRGPRPQHTDGLHLGQPPGALGGPGGVTMVTMGGVGGLGVHRAGAVIWGAGEQAEGLRAPDLEGGGAGGQGAGGAPGGVRHAAGGQGGEGLLRGGPRPLPQHRLQLELALFAGVCPRVGNSPYSAPPSSETKKYCGKYREFVMLTCVCE